MNSEDFRTHAHQLVDWMADYMDQVDQYDVKPVIQPGDIKAQLPLHPPSQQEAFEHIFKDFKDIIVPGMTHWQHPQFMAYFPSNRSEPSVLAEMLIATLGAQCMIWYTSPAAEELEERMMEWIREMLGLPEEFIGSIQDTASTASLVAMLVAREQQSQFEVNEKGMYAQSPFRIYASEQIHSSILKGVKIAGFGAENFVKIPTNEDYAMIPEALEDAIVADLQSGKKPLCVVAAIGTTSSTAIDPIKEIGMICKKHQVFLHVDAAYAGTALLLPEMRWMSEGMEYADSFVFNPHKWMFINFDCSVLYVKNKRDLINTFSILPEYLKTPEDQQVNNYRDWGIQLGRKFRALKLWFVIRSYGLEGLRNRIRDHIRYGKWLAKEINLHPDFELLAPVPLNLVCFRYHPPQLHDEQVLNKLNEELLTSLNNSGKILITQTKLNGKYTLRVVSGQARSSMEDTKKGWSIIQEYAKNLSIVSNLNL